jgi:ABC-2 type transport system permease protein
MRNIWVIAKREYKHYFISPVAYAISLMIFIVLGILFYASINVAISQQYAPGIEVVVSPLITLLLFTCPAVTMRLLAEEQKMGTLELLLTAPVRDWELVVGKWLGGVFFMFTLLIATWIYPIFLNMLVQPGIDQGLMVSSYIGLILMSMTVVAIGVAVSSLFSNQIAVFFLTLGVILVFWMIGYPVQNMAGTAGDIIRYLDASSHLNSFYTGVVEVKDIVYFLSLTSLSLFLGSISVEMKRWK